MFDIVEPELKVKMKAKLIDPAVYITKTTFFFGFVGALIGTALLAPFADTITHHPFQFPNTLYMLLIGYLIMGVPIAASTGLIYGLCLTIFDVSVRHRFGLAFASGLCPPLAFVASGYMWNPRTPMDSLIVLSALMLFTVSSSLMTAWAHRKAERRFRFLKTTTPGNIGRRSSEL